MMRMMMMIAKTVMMIMMTKVMMVIRMMVTLALGISVAPTGGRSA